MRTYQPTFVYFVSGDGIMGTSRANGSLLKLTGVRPMTNPQEAPIAQTIVSKLLAITPDTYKDGDEETITATWVNYGYPVEMSVPYKTIDGVDHIDLTQRIEFYVDTCGCDDNQYDGVKAEMERRYFSFAQLFANMFPFVANLAA